MYGGGSDVVRGPVLLLSHVQCGTWFVLLSCASVPATGGMDAHLPLSQGVLSCHSSPCMACGMVL